LMPRPNTDSAPNMLVTLLRNQLLIRCVVTSPVHAVTIRCYVMHKRYKCVPTLTGLPLCLSHSSLCLYIIFSRCIPLTAIQTVTHVSPLTLSSVSTA
jgi:hypothetical protein